MGWERRLGGGGGEEGEGGEREDASRLRELTFRPRSFRAESTWKPSSLAFLGRERREL